MSCRRFLSVALAAAVLAWAPCAAWAQVNNNANNNNVNGGAAAAGVEVDAAGVLRMRVVRDETGTLMRKRVAEARAALDPKVAAPSKLRKVSLTRLEAAAKAHGGKGLLPEEMRYLAGLTRIEYVFYYPETKEIVVAGPAEGWVVDLAGRPIGLHSGAAMLELEDLVVALRAFGPGGNKTKIIGVSIDPTQQGLQAMQRYLAQVGSRLTSPAQIKQLGPGLRQSLGLQTVTVRGVSPKTHFAQVLVEADYRMKLIGIGLEAPPVRMATFIDRVTPGALSRNALVRWYFVPNYESVRVSEDDLAMQIVGQGVKLVGADELVAADGTRRETGAADGASAIYTKAFTEKYPEIARRSPVYAQLKNLIDLSIVAAFIQSRDYYNKSGWRMEYFGDEGQFATEKYTTPAQVETAVNLVWKGSRLLTPIGGGVHIEPTQALATHNLQADEGNQLRDSRQNIDLSGLKADQWWWD